MLGENIKKLRTQNGYTQDELASRIHVVRQTISKWEKGISVPDADALSRLADVFEVDVSELLGTVIIHEEKEDPIARELAKLNRYLAVRNRRIKIFWRILSTLGIIIIIWGVLGTGYGVINYTAVVRGAAYDAETRTMILSACIAAFKKGIVRVLVGTAVTATACLMGKNS